MPHQLHSKKKVVNNLVIVDHWLTNLNSPLLKDF